MRATRIGERALSHSAKVADMTRSPAGPLGCGVRALPPSGRELNSWQCFVARGSSGECLTACLTLKADAPRHYLASPWQPPFPSLPFGRLLYPSAAQAAPT